MIQITDLLKIIQDTREFRGISSLISSNQAPFNLGLPRAARLPFITALRDELKVPILLITHRADRAFNLADELAFWLPDGNHLIFPEPNPLFYENAPWGLTTRRDRLTALTTLASSFIPFSDTELLKDDDTPILIASARAVMTRTLPRQDFLKACHTLKPGFEVQPDELIRSWVRMGYEGVNTVVSPGQFARRGGILDIWPASGNAPCRIDFFGDEIDSLRKFDPSTQRTQDSLTRVLIPPGREFIVEKESFDKIMEFSEFDIPLLHTTPASLLDYLPESAIVLVEDCEAYEEMVDEVESQAIKTRSDAIERGSITSDFPIPYITWDDLQEAFSHRRCTSLGPITVAEELSVDEQTTFARRFNSIPRFGGQVKTFMEHLSKLSEYDEPVLVVSRQANRLRELWGEYSLLDSDGFRPHFMSGSLSEGWTFTPESGQRVHLITDGEIFGWRRPEIRQRPRKIAEAPEAAYADLAANDWVVHVDHGVGRFTGLVRRMIDGMEREYLCVEYDKGDQLFVPIFQADRLSRYIGPDNRSPKLTRLGGGEWRTAKARVRGAVREIAEELLQLYAKRQIAIGHAFSPDSPWQSELEASFPYIETDDQIRVISDVKADMERSRPMDRLICGDVGYGKTEVALRAAFKAVMGGKQVVVLVPTTVLAQQHFHTFKQRLAAFPVEVEMLSRFRTPQQQREILERLANGTLDIVIGTHRLLQPDVQVKDLGLLIIDEEQRFGVTHKEFLKNLRAEVDVITMTATPIPRTLYMALTGVRDISTINTPPEERLPIITHVGPYSARLVRQAILREIERGGQIFFVHNRVQTIRGMRNRLQRLVPEAHITIAHGQMPEKELADSMLQFTAGDTDVLLTTSIIESGLDIPNANTLIVDRADTFGLAQLYQLRGRVGRGAQRAYAYFFRHARKSPTEEGRQRLETIAENTQLGAGYSIAMRDLEIRGAGDILGNRQHGHIMAVGFHLYTRLLAEAVHRLKVERDLTADMKPVVSPPKPDILELGYYPALVSVDLPLAISIPGSYVPDNEMRLILYRRMADLRESDELDALIDEFKDRFGPPPASTRNLFFQLKIKLLAEKIGLQSISTENGKIVLRYPTPVVGAQNRTLRDLGPNIRSGKNTYWLSYSDQEDWKDFLLKTLTELADRQRN